MTTRKNPIERYDLVAATFEEGTGLNRFGFNADGIHSVTGTSLDLKGFDCTGWNSDGWHFTGWNREGINKETGTRYDKRGYTVDGIDTEGYTRGGYDTAGFNREGFNVAGFDRNGIHKVTGTLYNEQGLDADGYDEQGFEGGYDAITHKRRTWNDFNESAWLRSDLYLDLPLHKETGTAYAPDGFNIFGFDADGYDRAGFDRIGELNTHIGYNRAGFDPEGYDEAGYDVHGYNRNGIDSHGFNKERVHVTTGTHWSPEDIHGQTLTPFNPEGFDIRGYDNAGFNKDGFDHQGWNARRKHRETGTAYDPEGLTDNGLDSNGFYPHAYGIKRDSFGYTVGERAPSRVYNLARWNHHISQEKLRTEDTRSYRGTPRNLHREGWRREPGQGWNAEEGCYIVSLAFTHKDTGTRFNPEGFSIIGINADRINERGFNVDTGIHETTGTKYGTDGWNLMRTEYQMV